MEKIRGVHISALQDGQQTVKKFSTAKYLLEVGHVKLTLGGVAAPAVDALAPSSAGGTLVGVASFFLGVAPVPLRGVALFPLVGVASAVLPTKEVKPQLSMSIAMTPSCELGPAAPSARGQSWWT